MGIVPNLFGKQEPQEPKVHESRPLTVTFERGRGQPRQSRAWSYGITPLGKQKVDSLSESDPRYLILATAKDDGACSIGEFAEKTHISPVKVNHLVNGRDGLVQAGCLRPVGSSGE